MRYFSEQEQEMRFRFIDGGVGKFFAPSTQQRLQSKSMNTAQANESVCIYA